MILTDTVAHGVADGRVNLAFRRWARPRVHPGDTFLSVAGVIRIVAITPVDPGHISADDAQRAGALSPADVRSHLRGDPTAPALRIELEWAGPDPRHELAQRQALTDPERAELVERLARLDRRSPTGPWTMAVLEQIAAHPGQRAAEAAAALGRDRETLKRNVRSLKNLGLTLSLPSGYELSPRGRALLERRA